MIRYITILTIILALWSCNSKKETNSITVEVNNPLDQPRAHILISIARHELPDTFNPEEFVVKEGDQVIPAQFTAKSGALMFVIDSLGPHAARSYTVQHSNQPHTFPKRTQAELSVKMGGEFQDRKYVGGIFKNVNFLRVPDEHTDHSAYIRYEGPGWESDKVGYRFYLDWRNATDVFGKTTKEMVLNKVGQDGFGSYHELQPWGMDVLKVGESLGIGSLGLFHDEKAIRVDKTDSIISRVVENGVVYSAIGTDYYGWEVAGQSLDIHSQLSIHAGTRLTHHQINVAGDPDNLCTGIGKDEKAELYRSDGDNKQWGYIATYGPQSLNNDKLGLAVLFPVDRFIEFTADEHSNIVKLKPESGELNYYFFAAWEKEPGGITTAEEFLAYVKATAMELASPVIVTVKNP